MTSGQTLSSQSIASGDTLIVLAGGTITSIDILNGASTTISGVENYSTIEAGATETLLAGTVTGDLVLGLQQILSGTSGVVVDSILKCDF